MVLIGKAFLTLFSVLNGFYVFIFDSYRSTGATSFRIREAILAGIIIAVLTAVYSVILMKKGDDSMGCGGCSCGRFDQGETCENKNNPEQ